MRSITKIIFSLPFDIIWMSVVFMWLMPFGTFDYYQVEFYLCIIQAIIIASVIRLWLKKHQKNYMGKIK